MTKGALFGGHPKVINPTPSRIPTGILDTVYPKLLMVKQRSEKRQDILKKEQKRGFTL